MIRHLRPALVMLWGMGCALLFAQNTPNLRLLRVIDPTPAPGNPVRYSEVTGCGVIVLLAGWSFTGGGWPAFQHGSLLSEATSGCAGVAAEVDGGEVSVVPRTTRNTREAAE